MANLTVQTITEAGIAASYSSAGGSGDTAANDGRLLLHVKNGGGAAIDVTITAQKPTTSKPGFGSVAKSNAVVNIGAGADKFIGPFPVTAFNNAAGQIAIGYSATTSVTVAALRLPAVN